MPDRLLIVSAGDLLAKGFVAIAADRRAPDGAPSNALYGVTRSIVRAVAAKQPKHAVAVIGEDRRFDDPALQPQRARLPGVLERLGFVVFEVPEEAEAVASYVAAADGADVVIVGSDKRLAQLVAERVWWHDAYKDARYTPEMVSKRFGVGPDQVAPWLALVGDDDSQAGIKGIGKKGATTLLERFGTLEAAVERVDELDTRTRNALKAAAGAVLEALSSARLRGRAVPVAFDALAFTPPSAESLDALHAELGFFELLSSPVDDHQDTVICDTEAAVQRAIAEVGTALASVHALIEDPSPIRGALSGLAIVAESGERFFVPLSAHRSEVSIEALKDWLEDEARPKVGHEVATLFPALMRGGIQPAGFVGDSACASHLVEPSNFAPHDLPDVTRWVLHRGLSIDDEIRGVGHQRLKWVNVDVAAAAGHAASYADAAADVWRTLEPRIDAARCAEYLALSETVARMALRGVGVDGAELDRVGEDFQRAEADLETEIFGHAGRDFNLASAKQLGAVLFEDLELTVLKRTKTGWSTATDALERIQHEHPIVSLVVRWRALRRMRNTWITSLKGTIDPDGRVRSTFHPARSFSGRLVNSSPDLGRVPGRTDEMRRIRRAFVAGSGCVLMSIDYRQLGLYVLAHLTGDPALVEPLREEADMHTLTAATVLEVSPDAVTADQRQLGKVVNFATFAGQGASALAQQLAVSPQEAKQLIERFDRRYAVVRAFQEEQLRLAREQGHIVTVAGRRWPIGGLTSRDPQDLSYAERLARRATHEGSVADVSRRGLLEADRALRAAGLSAAPLLQIHDEVLFEVAETDIAEASRVAGNAMSNAFSLRVPLKVGKKVGPNWADMTPVGS